MALEFDPRGYEPGYVCGACGEGGVALASGYCLACEAGRGIPGAMRLTPDAAYAARVIALRQLDAR